MDQEVVKQWIEQKDKLTQTKAVELEFRSQICDHILQEKIKGTKKGVIGVYTLTATAKLNAKIDKDLLKTIWNDLSPIEKKAIRFKPEIVAKEYKAVAAKSILHQAITHKPGTPGLELKGIKV